MQARATWKGSLNVSLVSLAVKAYSADAPEQQAVSLHQLHRDCHCRIRYQKQCPQHGAIPGDQVVMGFEHAPDRHVVIDLDELDRLRSERQRRAIQIDTFFAEGAVSPLYFAAKKYYLLPDGPTARVAYALLLTAMRTRRVQAVAQVVLSKREQLVLLRPYDENLLLMTTLKYAAQVRSPAELSESLTPAPPPAPQELALAQALVDQRTCPQLDLARYKDEYADKLSQLIEAKLSGQQLVAPPEQEPQVVLSLMQALQQSVAGSGKTVAEKHKKKPGRIQRQAAGARKTASRRRPRKKSA